MQLPSNLPSVGPRATTREISFSATLLNPNGTVATSRKPRYAPPAVPRKPVSSFVCMPAEPEDAYITGATRSLSRRLLALNIRCAS